MANSENRNLFFLKNGTELHINPKKFKLPGLKQLLRYQIFAEQPTEIILVTNHDRYVLSSNAMKNARELFGKERGEFLAKNSLAMREAKEIIILGKPDIKRSIANKLRDPRYDTVFKDFINNDPYLPRLDR